MVKCSFCKCRDAVYARAYSGEKLCADCFCTSIENKVKATVSKYRMFQPNDKIIVGVSGGKDSVTLLHILTAMEKKFPGTSITALTVDEGIKGYRDQALTYAEKNCDKLEVPHKTVSFKELFGVTLDELVKRTREKKRMQALTPCAYCGVLRRRALNVTSREVRADKLATAHNLDDEAQTILLNLFHGDPFRIARVQPLLEEKHGRLVDKVKPFCEVPEKEIAFYAYLRGIEFQDVPCPYASSALRNDVRALLNRMEEKHAGVKFTLFQSAERIRPALEKAGGNEQLHECLFCGEPSADSICRVCGLLRGLGVFG